MHSFYLQLIAFFAFRFDFIKESQYHFCLPLCPPIKHPFNHSSNFLRLILLVSILRYCTPETKGISLATSRFPPREKDKKTRVQWDVSRLLRNKTCNFPYIEWTATWDKGYRGGNVRSRCRYSPSLAVRVNSHGSLRSSSIDELSNLSYEGLACLQQKIGTVKRCVLEQRRPRTTAWDLPQRNPWLLWKNCYTSGRITPIFSQLVTHRCLQ